MRPCRKVRTWPDPHSAAPLYQTTGWSSRRLREFRVSVLIKHFFDYFRYSSLVPASGVMIQPHAAHSPREGKDGHLDRPSGLDRPQARRLRRPAPRLWGLTPVPSRERGIGAVDGSLCLKSRQRSLRANPRSLYFAPIAVISSVHLRLSRISALAMMMIFRMMATMATFASFPARRSASYFSLS